MTSSEELAIPYKYNLSIIRAQSFFTFGFTVRNDKGLWLLDIDSHYERLKTCYGLMYEKSQLPFNFHEFKEWIETILSENRAYKQRLSCSIILSAGTPRQVVSNTGCYASGFGGDLAQMSIIVQPLLTKPMWSFEQGINAITYAYQRPHAAAKPNYYMGGVLGQHIIDTLNRLVVLKYASRENPLDHNKEALCLSLMKDTYNAYQLLNEKQQQRLRVFLNDINTDQDCIEASFKALFSQQGPEESAFYNVVEGIDWGKMSDTDVKRMEEELFQYLVQEVIFCHPSNPNVLLEGSTFSLMALSKNDEIVFFPNKLSKEDGIVIEDDNDGTSLVSTTIHCLKTLVKQRQLPHQVRAISQDQLTDCKAVFAVSTTRVKINETGIHLQPIASLNGVKMPLEDLNNSPVYQALVQGIRDYINDYEHDSASINEAIHDSLLI